MAVALRLTKPYTMTSSSRTQMGDDNILTSTFMRHVVRRLGIRPERWARSQLVLQISRLNVRKRRGREDDGID